MSGQLNVEPPARKPGTTTTVPSSRASSTAASKPQCKIHAHAVVSDKAIIAGTKTVFVDANTVLHPYAKLDSTFTPIRIGSNCIVAERTSVGATQSPTQTFVVEIEDGVSIEAGAIVEAKHIGRNSIVEVNAIIGQGSLVGQVRATQLYIVGIAVN